eukprot:13597153-Alexandrium_andersonii.AAC.1
MAAPDCLRPGVRKNARHRSNPDFWQLDLFHWPRSRQSQNMRNTTTKHTNQKNKDKSSDEQGEDNYTEEGELTCDE